MSNSSVTAPTLLVEDREVDYPSTPPELGSGAPQTAHNGSIMSSSNGTLSQIHDNHIVDVEDTQALTTKSTEDSSETNIRPLSRRSSMENFGLVSLLTPALPVLPGIQGNDDWAKKFHELQDEHKDLILAAAHIDDALHGRGAYGKARAIFKSNMPQKCFYVIDNKWWRRTVALFIVLFSILPIWESPNKSINPGQVQEWVLALEIICIAILITDLSLHVVFYTWSRFWSLAETKWQRVEFVFTCLFVIDFIILCTQELVSRYSGTTVRLVMPFRCLRAAAFMCKAKNVGHIFNVCISIVFKLGKVFLVIVLFIFLFAGVGVHLFGEDYHFIGCQNRTQPEANCTEDLTNVYTGSFDNFGNAALQLFVLLTTENYPEFMMPAFKLMSISIIYFGVFLYVGVFFLTAILLAIIVDNYWDFSKKNVKVERKRERAEIIKAWNILDPLGVGSLNVNDEKLVMLFKKLRPQNSNDEIKELIDYVDEDGDGVIDTFEWTTRLNDALNYEFDKEPSHYNQTFCPKCAVRCSESVRRGVQSVAFTRVILVLIIIHSVLFFVKWHKMSDDAIYVVQGLKTGIIAIFLVEAILRIIAMGHHLQDQPLEVADLVITFIAVITNLLWYLFKFIDMDSKELALGVITVLSCFCVMVRMGFNSKQTKAMVLTFLRVCPVMFDLTILITIIAYFYALLGLESFFGNVRTETYSASHYDYDCGLGFETLSCSLLVVFQMLSTSNWHEIMNATMISVSGWAWIYFMTCYLVINLVFINLFVAIAIEAFNKLAATEDELNNTTMMETRHEEDKTFAESAKKFFSNVLASSRDKQHQQRRPSLAVINQDRRKSLSVGPISRGQLAFLQTDLAEDRHERLSFRSRSRIGRHTPDRLSIASASQLNNNQSHGDHLTVPTVTQPESPSESEPEDMSGLTMQQKREKLFKKRRQKRKRTISKIKVMMAFRKKGPDQIDLHVGDEVKILETKGEWMRGMSRGKTGWFPAEYVMETVKKNRLRAGRVSPEPPNIEEPKVDNNQNQSNPFINAPEDIRPSAGTTPANRVDDVASSLMKSRMKKQGGDWRRRIHGDMTVMNHEEMLELNKLVKAGFKNRGRQNSSGSEQRLHISSGRENTISEANEIIEEEPESSRLVPQAPPSRDNKVTKQQISIDPSPDLPEVIEEEEEEAEEGMLNVEKPKLPKSLKKEKKRPGGEMPEWAKKFVQDHSLQVKDDIKVDKNLKELPEDKQSNSSRKPPPRRSSLTVTSTRRRSSLVETSRARQGSASSVRSASAKSNKSVKSSSSAKSVGTGSSVNTAFQSENGENQGSRMTSTPDKKIPPLERVLDPEWGTDTNDSTDKTINAIMQTMDEAEKTDSRPSTGRSHTSEEKEPKETQPENAQKPKGRRNRSAMIAKLKR